MLSRLTLPFDPIRLRDWATKRGITAPGEFYDEAYAAQSALLASVGAAAPRSFALRLNHKSGPRLIGHTILSETVFENALLSEAKADALPVFQWEAMSIRPVAAIVASQELSFSLRFRPIVRTSVTDPSTGRSRDIEMDAYQGENGKVDERQRYEVYRRWVESKLTDATELTSYVIEKFKISSVLLSSRGGRRAYARGPDALMRGVLKPLDASLFCERLLSGIGRHKANGYGFIALDI